MLTLAELERLSHERHSVKVRYQTLFNEVAGILFANDPQAINYETNTDEYDPEVGTILPRLHLATNTEDVALIVHQEFVRWFGAEEVGIPADFQLTAEMIWRAWNNFSARPDIES